MNKAEFKSEGMDALRIYLLAQKTSVRQSELARHFGVNRSTIGRWILSLEAGDCPIRWDEQKRVSIDRERYFTNLKLTRHESVVLMLALRLYQQRQDKADRNTVEMLQKLGIALRQGIAPQAGEHVLDLVAQQRRQLLDQPSDHQRILEAIGEAWLDTRKVQIRYRPLHARRAFDDTFHPYLLEPSSISRGIYVIGHSELVGAVRVRKLERIERTPTLLDERFSVAPGFDPLRLLGGAWGVWFDEGGQPATVRLRFNGEQAVRRVGEERWHPSQRTERDGEGRLIWTAEIDEPLELLPWVRGWGASCEILEPIELRNQLIGEVRRQQQLYGIASSTEVRAQLVAHTPAHGSEEWHLLIDHLTHVAQQARGFAEVFGAGALAYQLGLWHDVGKANPEFQSYLRRCYNDPSQRGTGPDHKAAGAVLALRYFRYLALLVQGHHGGLQSQAQLDTWIEQRTKELEADGQRSVIDASIETIRTLLPAIEPGAKLPFPSYIRDRHSAEFFLRMLFSTLVDADYLDTERHRNPSHFARRSVELAIQPLLERFEAAQQNLTGRREDTVGRARHVFYKHCCTAAELPPGLFRLAIPTGGGKTRSAMAFALRHALKNGLRRVVVAVPFISITEQTAQVYREIFEAGTEAGQVVLEHHSGVEGRRDESREFRAADQWARLASENWDAPIVVTTTVQLFESLFANRTGRCRKLHRLAGSVIVLDEVQALPPHLLTPILSAIRELCTNYGATVVLSTATQPAFESLPEFANLPAHNIIPDATEWFATLKRVRYEWQTEAPLAWDEVAELMRRESQALGVVNTKGDALSLLDALNDPETLHLSTMLCGAHRRDVIAEVHERLRLGQPCRLVSTQVIEAGVDLDFPLVLRALGPLDRVIQAAGRCNREGRPEPGRVVVFAPAEGRLPQGAYSQATELTHSMLRGGSLDPDDPEIVASYFRRLFTSVNRDREKVQSSRESWDYPETATRFRMIDEEMEHVIVAYSDAETQEQTRKLIEAIREKTVDARYALRRIQPFLVSVRTRDAERYRLNGLIEPLMPDNALAIGIWHGKYDTIRGLVADDDRAALIF